MNGTVNGTVSGPVSGPVSGRTLVAGVGNVFLRDDASEPAVPMSMPKSKVSSLTLTGVPA